jgi:membrane associated rhomboid family serine protease
MTLPLLVEAELLALSGFGMGLLLAYLFELRRRARRFKPKW